MQYADVNDVIVSATAYTEAGIITHPLHFPGEPVGGDGGVYSGKEPVKSKWQKRTEPTNRPDLEFSKKGNIGFLCGKASNLTTVDIDYGYPVIVHTLIGDGKYHPRCDADFVKVQHTADRWHWHFQHEPGIKAGQFGWFGFDVLGEDSKGRGDNCVAPPSIHSDGSSYKFTQGKIEDRPKMPSFFKDNLKMLIDLHGEFDACVKKCRPWVMKFLDECLRNKGGRYFHNVSVFHGADGRARTLALLSEMKANGASEMVLRVTCTLIFDKESDDSKINKELPNVHDKPPKADTLRADPIIRSIATDDDFKLKPASTNAPARTMAAPTYHVTGSDLGIDDEFEGLYTVEMHPVTGAPIVTVLCDRVAYRVIEKLHLINYSNNFFVYMNGYYQNNSSVVWAEVLRIVRGIRKDSHSNGVKRICEDVMLIVRTFDPAYTYPFNIRVDAFPVRNGVVVFDFETGEARLEPADPDRWRFDYLLPVDYDPTNKSTVLLDVIKAYADDWPMLIQVVAQALLQKMGYGPYKMAYLLKGAKNCGKTTFLDIVERLVGENNRCSVPLSELTPAHRFSRASMEGKLLNIDDDLGFFRITESGIFKKLVGGTKQRIERKGVDAYDVILTCVNMFTTNTPAGFDQKIFVDDAFWSRWCYVEFTHTFEKDDSFRQRVLTDENLSGLLNAVIEMLIKIRANGDLLHVQYWADVREKWTQESNMLFKFIDENMVAGGRTAIIKDDLLAALTKFGMDQKIDNSKIPETVNALTQLVEVVGGEKDAKRMFGQNPPARAHCYVLNYTMKPNSPYAVYFRKESGTFSSSHQQNFYN